MQTTYSTAPAIGVEGGIADSSEAQILTRVCQTSSIPFGRMVVRGTADNQAAIYATANAVPLGVSVFTQKQNNSDGTCTYNQYEAINIVTQGNVFVSPENAVTQGQAVWVRHTAGGAGLTVGRFTDSSVTSAAATAMTGMVYDTTTTTTNGIAMLRLNLPA